MKTNIAVFASGRGSNFLAIAKAVKSGKLRKTNLAFLLCDNPNAPVISKAKKLKIKVILIKPEADSVKDDFENKVIRNLRENKIELIVLAGFMRILSRKFVAAYKNKIINIHPSLLPAFKGKEGIRDAYEYGVKVTGVTVHFVDERMDHGPIILQREVKIEGRDTLLSLENKIHRIEHQIYPKAIELFINNKLELKGRRIIVKNR
jgi:phosphoribosylglycinamide formyltransferase-1